MMLSRQPPTRTVRLRGIALVEAVLATLVVAIAIGAGLQAATASAKSRRTVLVQAISRQAAQAMLDEIVEQHYEEPGSVSAALGVDAGESRSTSRTTLDDVDDYAGLTETTLRSRDGTSINLAVPLTRRVSVTWVRPSDPATSASTETGIKLVVVEVLSAGRVITRLEALRTRAMDVALRRRDP
jgi:type II secretory pathway pseudopilin PulG